MSAKDTLLLEEAYNLVMINEGMISSFVLGKLKKALANVVSQAKQQQPQEFDKLISVLQNKDVNALKQLFNQYNTGAEVKKLMGTHNESYVTEGILGSTGKVIENILITISDTILGKPGSGRFAISAILMMVLMFAIYALMLSQGAVFPSFQEFGAVADSMNLLSIDFWTTTGLQYLTKAIGMIFSLLPGSILSNRQINRDRESRQGQADLRAQNNQTTSKV